MKELFDSPDWLFELKVDGFRALAYIENGQCRFISRHGLEFRGFKDLCSSVAGSFQVMEFDFGWGAVLPGDDGGASSMKHVASLSAIRPLKLDFTFVLSVLAIRSACCI